VGPVFGDDGTAFEFGGHIKYRFVTTTYPEHSLFRQFTGSNSKDNGLDVRLKFAVDRARWDIKADYQLAALYGDTIDFTRALPTGVGVLFPRLPSDERRLFDLTDVIEDEGKIAVLQRLDRLSVGYTSDKTVLRIGRQAISWGNGLIYAPMDIFNPFDPAAVDKEYKSGDDMLYGQYLRDNGDDLQAVWVVRRDPVTGDVEAQQSSMAVKYHGISGQGEFDALLARHFDETLLAAGGNRSIGGAVWRGDLVLAFTGDEPTGSFVTSLSQSYTWGGKNVSGIIEYFFNGFGQSDGCYSTEDLAGNPKLLERVSRRELFTLGRHYVALSAVVEVTPLFLLTPNLFTNVSDGSALVQVVTQHDLKENFMLLGALNVPLGTKGTEFGGIETDQPNLYLSSGPSLFVQLAWYF
jgi:hypothetical protein